jgi:cytochrome c peroxidase
MLGACRGALRAGRSWRPFAFSALICFSLTAAAASYDSIDSGQQQRNALAPLPDPPSLDERKVNLGKKLFGDVILSGKGLLTCASCHDLEAGGTVNLKRTVGYNGKMHRFNAPTVFNVGNNYRLGWRGDFTSLEDQNEKVLLDDNLMAADWPSLLARLKTSGVYTTLFEDAFGRQPDRTTLLEALAIFQRSLSTPNAPFDRYLRGEINALTPSEVQGYSLFRSYGCASCHQGSNIGGNMFQKFGIFAEPTPNGTPVNDGDLGRWTVTGQDRDKGVFRVPSLRNVEVTAPYFHDGRVESLAEAVTIMAHSQLGRELPATEISSIVAFLKTLTGYYNGHKLTASAPQGKT